MTQQSPNETKIGFQHMGGGKVAKVYREERNGVTLYFMRYLGPDGRVITTAPTAKQPRLDETC